MTEIQPKSFPDPAPTPGEVMTALRIRDKVAVEIRRKVNLDPESAKRAAEYLIERGYVDIAKVYADVYRFDSDDNDDEPYEDDGPIY